MAVLGGCTSDSAAPTEKDPPARGSAAGTLAAAGAAGLIAEDVYQRRIDQYLAVATKGVDPGGATSIGTQLVAAHRDPAFSWDPTAVTVDALADTWEQIDTWEDTRDFSLMYLHWVLALADRSSPMTTLDPAVIEAIEQRMVDNRYQWNDPLPDDRIDDQWFWSENHLIIGLVNEHLAGKRMPERTFTVTGLTGAEHAERSKQPILDWVHERAEFGFFEWHSHVYMKKNLTPLLTLVEFSDDPDLVLAAAMGLDLCILDMASFCHAGVYAASRGRTYAKDKLGVRESIFDAFKLLFDDTDLDWAGGADSVATYFAGSQRYRPPQALLDMATAPSPGVVRERHGLFVDGSAPVVDDPEDPAGRDFDDPENLGFWWSQGMLGTWQMTTESLAAAKEFRLFETAALGQVKALVDLNGGDPDRVREFLQANNAIVNFGHLREANTYGWRSDAVSLATVVDHRFGEMRDQIHTWQATIAPGAVVFTTHPRTGAPAGEDWADDAKPGYWTGEASIPRSAQHERTGIHIYQPKWDASTNDLLWSIFGYQDFTHAYVPQDRFDQVEQSGNWTFARKDDGYIALWSWRTPRWRVADAAVEPTDGRTGPFELIAPGGPDNVWIVEVGDAADAGSFEDFVAAVTASEPEVARGSDGFTVAWDSPSSGPVGFGSTGPFTVDGKEQELGDFPRHESTWGTVDHLATAFSLRSDAATLELDFDTPSRKVGRA
ncbi:hypothetical protein ACE2AJ_06715 [Aquihabitans daechungensis]|uniref:hypothetical protein n=1 Tax=Aquihabitans daechungensis TaxID=1052257 RepID=UPI003BA01BB2